MTYKILMIITLIIAILVIIVALKSLWTDDPCPKKPDIDIGEEAWLLEIKKKDQGESHISKLTGKE
ncbi:unnamed protein product [marine sediment metagenome]|uniref:Uncharacterized protein n=1 Tax=marine sediment metagenome TaxID=412755 RepID=X1BL85_9ZZZZ